MQFYEMGVAHMVRDAEVHMGISIMIMGSPQRQKEFPHIRTEKEIISVRLVPISQRII